MKIGFKIKFTRNIPAFLPHLDILSSRLDFLELGLRLNEDFKEYDALRRKNLFFTLHAPFQENGFNPAEPAKKKTNKENIFLALEAAEYFKAPVIVIHPGDRETVNSSLRQFCQFFKRYYDRRYCMENLPEFARSLPFPRIAYEIDDLKKIQDETSSRACLDFGHALLQAITEGRDFYQYVQAMIERLRPLYFHLHNNDGKKDRHWQITDPRGIIDYAKIFPLLPQDALLCLEVYAFGEKEFDLKGLLRDVDYLKNLPLDSA